MSLPIHLTTKDQKRVKEENGARETESQSLSVVHTNTDQAAPRLISSHTTISPPLLTSHLFPSLLIQPLICSATHLPIQPHPTPNNHSCPRESGNVASDSQNKTAPTSPPRPWDSPAPLCSLPGPRLRPAARALCARLFHGRKGASVRTGVDVLGRLVTGNRKVVVVVVGGGLGRCGDGKGGVGVGRG